MDSPEINPIGLPIGGGCDESKCVSQGGWNRVSSDASEPFANPFTCYGDEGEFYPKMCADGFVPVAVEDEPTASSASWYGFAGAGAGVPVSYFTCCPPTPAHAAAPAAATRRCSDPIAAPAHPSSSGPACDDDDGGGFVHPRPMKSNTLRMKTFGPLVTFYESATGIDSHLCCNYNDTGSVSVSADFLDATECVPYRNEGYDGFFQENRIGSVFDTTFPISCDFPEDSFSIPRPSSTSRYQCCKNGTEMPPYVQDLTFNINVYTSIVLFIISAVLSLIVVIALMIPLVKELKRTPSQRRRKPGFSTYNVYLICLAFLDLVWCMYGVIARGLYINQVFIPYATTISMTMGLAYCVGNFWINALVSYQVVVLLKFSSSAQRTRLPSLKKLIVQGGVVYTVVVVYGAIVGLYFIPNGDLGIFYAAHSVMIAPPVLYVNCLPIWIWWHGYLPDILGSARRSSGVSATREKAMRDLALYFFRVIFVFMVLYVPCSIFTFLVKGWRTWPGYVNECILAIQPALTFVFILQKPDVNKYIVDLFTLSRLCGGDETETMKGAKPPKTPTVFQDSDMSFKTVRTYHNSSLGFFFLDIRHNGDDENPERNDVSGFNHIGCGDGVVGSRDDVNSSTNDLDGGCVNNPIDDAEEAMQPDDSDRDDDSKQGSSGVFLRNIPLVVLTTTTTTTTTGKA